MPAVKHQVVIIDCPRCKKAMSRYPALSRTDNKTLVCANCGLEEAIEMFTVGVCAPQTVWPVGFSTPKFLWQE